jgi:hypothetical protein
LYLVSIATGLFFSFFIVIIYIVVYLYTLSLFLFQNHLLDSINFCEVGRHYCFRDIPICLLFMNPDVFEQKLSHISLSIYFLNFKGIHCMDMHKYHLHQYCIHSLLLYISIVNLNRQYIVVCFGDLWGSKFWHLKKLIKCNLRNAF